MPCAYPDPNKMAFVLPCFAHTSNGGELWPFLIEKAWAKMHKSYCLTRQGTAVQAFSALTGKPVQKFDHYIVKNPEDLWQTMQFAHNRDFILTAQLFEDDEQEDGWKQEMGPKSAHSLPVLSIHSVKIND
jgi:hypothetical protein